MHRMMYGFIDTAYKLQVYIIAKAQGQLCCNYKNCSPEQRCASGPSADKADMEMALVVLGPKKTNTFGAKQQWTN